MNPAHGTLRVFEDAAALARAAAEEVCARAETAGGRFMLNLSGGSTPKPLYMALASPPLRDRFPWDRAQFTWGDERFVPPDHPASNARMVREAMLSRVPVAPGQVHPVPTTGMTPGRAAACYERSLQTLYGADRLDPARPLFDVVLLGLGEDGHTASLLPGQPVLEERTRWVAAVPQGREEVRITLTYPALESTRAAIFLVAGAGKRDVLDRILSGGSEVPAARLRPQGELLWFADRAAAGRWAG
ncbi:6-phosphogluconolactonase [Roseomonas chloroacetimidivorans]|uniref:6-phosphogluconolactonase n=1 Tax=Roseomonas chloroacetimidivorans TaxID=1766656 RepID=UPI003C785B1E